MGGLTYRFHNHTITGMIHEVIAHYSIGKTVAVEPLGNAGGFSGCQLWRVTGPTGRYCLRRWPTAASLDRLRWIHDVLQFAYQHHCRQLIIPMRARTGDSLLAHASHYWELTPWAIGSADFTGQPSTRRLNSAIAMLADFHRATAAYSVETAVSPNLQQIMLRLENYDETIERLEPRLNFELGFLSRTQWQQMRSQASDLRHELLRELSELKETRIPVQPVIRDIHADHIFFDGDAVSALIDFGAMRTDTVACDLSRMLGSLVGDNSVRFEQSVERYETHRPLTVPERRLTRSMNRAGVLVGLLNWCQWIFVDQRRFESSISVRDRILHLLSRLQRINEAGL